MQQGGVSRHHHLQTGTAVFVASSAGDAVDHMPRWQAMPSVVSSAATIFKPVYPLYMHLFAGYEVRP